MYPTPSQTREHFAAPTSEADHLLDLIAGPVTAEMAVWSDATAGNDDPLDPWPSTYALYHEARTGRAAMIAKLFRVGARAAHRAIVRTLKRYRRRLETRAIYKALSGLDDRTLRDLGFHRSEILSVAAEVTGEAEPTRTIVRAAPRAPA